MSENNTNQPVTSNKEQSVQDNQEVNTSVSVDISNISGTEALELAKQSKATGKSIEDLLKEKNGAKTSQNEPGKVSTEKVGDNKDLVKEAVAEAKRKLKIGDEEVDEEEVLKVYKSRKDHQRAANKELQEGKAARKQAEEFLNMMKDKSSLFEVIQKLGHDPRSLAEEYLVSQLQEEMLDPREKELKEAKRKLQAYQDMERKQQQQIEQARLEEMKAKYTKEFNDQFVDALKNTDLPPTKAMVSEMAKYISRSARIGFKMTPIEAAQLVKEDVQKAQMNLIGNADGETLLKLLGDDVAAKILQARGQKVKQTGFSTPNVQGEKREIQPRRDGKRMSTKEWKEFNRKK